MMHNTASRFSVGDKSGQDLNMAPAKIEVALRTQKKRLTSQSRIIPPANHKSLSNLPPRFPRFIPNTD